MSIEVDPVVLRGRARDIEHAVDALLDGPHTPEAGGRFVRANGHLQEIYSQLDDSIGAAEARAMAHLGRDIFPLPRYQLLGDLSGVAYGLRA